MIQTVKGKINKKELGITYPHEHIILDLTLQNAGDMSVLLDVDEMSEELEHAKIYNVKSIVDLTNIGLGRNVKKLKEVSKKSDMNIICSTGFYKEQFYPNYVFNKSKEELCEVLIKEIETGIENAEIKAGMIGEIGSSLNEITDTEKKVFQAAAIAHNKTGIPINTHCEYGTMAADQTKLLLNMNVDPGKIILGHMDLNENIKEIKELLKQGINIAFDTIGKNQYCSNEDRVKNLVELINCGFESQLFLSQDNTEASQLKKNGGQGYTYIFDNFISELKKYGINQKTFDQIMINNPANILDI